jgi:serine/threonine protein phosphatase 1
MPTTFAIGDIHGGLRALEQVLNIVPVSEEDLLIFLGDYVDGWSQSAQTIDYLIHLSTINNCVFIKGNHDVWCENWLGGQAPDPNWMAHNGGLTIKSYHNYSKTQMQEHAAFFQQMKLYYVDNKNRLFIHAGFTSMHGPEKERDPSDFYWDRSLWEVALATDNCVPKLSKHYPKRLLLYDEIFIGHTPTINYDTDKPIHASNLWNIDTGAAFYGKLTVMDVESKNYWQSDTVRDLYPGETGRNAR